MIGPPPAPYANKPGMNWLAITLVRWQPFYSAVAAAAATLLGLLFVALSLNLDRLRGPDGLRHKRLARVTFTDLLYVLVLALVFLVPDQSPQGFALVLAILALSRTQRFVAELRHQAADGSRAVLSKTFRDHAVTVVVFVGLGLVSVAVLFGQPRALFGLVAIIATLFASASRSAWQLLLEIKPPEE